MFPRAETLLPNLRCAWIWFLKQKLRRQKMEAIQSRKRRGGRPKLSPEERRAYTVRVGFTESQYNKLIERAEAAGLADSELIRRLAINQQFHTVPAINRTALIELNKMGVNLNQIAKAANMKTDLNFGQIFEQVKANLNRLRKS
jgi:hypothetical protein